MYKLKTTAKFGESGGTKDYEKLENKPQINGNELIGNKTSADLGLQPAGQYLTEETDPTVPSYVKNISENDIASWNNKSDFSGDYDDLTNKPDLSQFITNTVNNLTNYYLKSETYTKDEVTALIGTIQQFHYEIVQELPQTGANNILYLVPKAESQTQNVYDEYVYANNAWEKIGDTEIDLSDYVTTTQLNTALANYTTTADLTTLLAGKQNTIDSTHKLSSDLVDDTNATNKFVTSSEKTTWNGKQDLLTAGDNITIDSNNVISASATTHFYINHDSTSYQLSAENLAILQQAYEKYLNNEYFTMTLRSKYQNFSQSSDYKMEFITVIMESNTAYFYFIIPSYANNNKNYSGFYYIIAPVSDGSLTKGELRSGAFNIPLIPNYAYQMNNGPYALVLNNTLAYTPTAGSYNPATAKYAEDQAEAVRVQYSTMPTANADNLGKIVQYTGTTDSTYTQGHFYTCVSDGEATPTYSWQEISLGGEDSSVIFTTNELTPGATTEVQEKVGNLIDKMANNEPIPQIILKNLQTNIFYVLTNYTITTASSYKTATLYFVALQQDGYSEALQYNSKKYEWTKYSNNSILINGGYSDVSKHKLLSFDNTTSFTPTGDYNPSTKKYTDDKALSTVVADKLTGTSAPTTSTVGYVGQQYTDTTNNNQYVCTAVDTVTPEYTWVQVNGGGDNPIKTITDEDILAMNTKYDVPSSNSLDLSLLYLEYGDGLYVINSENYSRIRLDSNMSVNYTLLDATLLVTTKGRLNLFLDTNTEYGLYAFVLDSLGAVYARASYVRYNLTWTGYRTFFQNLFGQRYITSFSNGGQALTIYNETSYTPTSDYNPATKKYVDDQVGAINTVLATLTTPTSNGGN